ncbi:MAG: beta strand repeat-containing protein, partial [Plesiomonas sp.]
MFNNIFTKCSLPLLFLASPLQAAPSISLSSSRMVNRSPKVAIEQQKTLQQLEGAGAFASFSTQPRVQQKAEAAPEEVNVLAFLEQNGLLQSSDVVAATNSGNLDSEFNKSLSDVFVCMPPYSFSDCKIASINRQTPTESPTNADTLTWRFLFDLAVTGVDAADFNIGGTTATITGITQNTSTDYSITISGGDLASFNGTASISLKPAGQYDIRLVYPGLTPPDDLMVPGVRGINNNFYVVSNNVAPTDISLTSTSVNQSGGINAVVGTLSSTDADVGDSHTYTLVSGAGDTNNASFNISGSALRVNNAALLTAGTYNVRVRTADNASATYEEAFTITVVDNVPPTVTSITLSGSPANTATSVDFVVAFDTSANNISIDDFQLTSTAGAAGTISAVSASSGTSVNVTVNGISGNGTLRLDLKSSTNISDSIGNAGPAAYTSGSVHNVAIPTAPTAPTIGTATAGDGQVSVTFTAPSNNGGSAITTYTATANPDGAFGTCAGPAACTATVTGLDNGTAYTFTVTATNGVGTSVASGASNSAIPKGNQTITFTQPSAQNFGTTPTLTATADSATGTDNLTVSFSSSTTGVCTISSGGNLAFVTAGSCTIDADQAGDSATNPAPTVSRTFTVNAVVPSAPTVGTATAGDTQATVTFSAPANNGGAPILAGGYTVTANPGNFTGTGSSSPITVTGLTNGVAYTFTVTATNSAGTGVASAASNSVTPASPQTITFANPG